MFVLACAALAVSACGGSSPSPGNAGGNVTLQVGQSTQYTLYTHCGILDVTINSLAYYAEPPLSDVSGNPPAGWGNPFDGGVITLTTATTADFRDAAGHTAHFTSAPKGPTPTIGMCA
jgi:hypothetical protein